MKEASKELLDHEARIQALRVSVYSQPDPAENEGLLRKLAEAEKQLRELKQQSIVASPEVAAAGSRAVQNPSAANLKPHFLGQETTKLKVDTRLHMQPLPTGIYHLLDPQKSPLLTVTVTNQLQQPRRIRVTAYIEGLSARAVKTLELKKRGSTNFVMHPTLLPERASLISEVQWATLHVIVDILGSTDGDGALGTQSYAVLCECHDTLPILCLARTSSFNATRDPQTHEYIDLSRYYGAWVTPHVPAVQFCIRQAVDFNPDKQMWGYLGHPESVTGQVKALYQSLKKAELKYIHSVIDFGAASGQATQRTRLPRESLEYKSANCIDGTVLMASLLEAVTLNPAIVLVPGHAFLGWEVQPDTDKFEFLETTMIGSADFEAACASGKKQYETADISYLKRLAVAQLRREGIYPME